LKYSLDLQVSAPCHVCLHEGVTHLGGRAEESASRSSGGSSSRRRFCCGFERVRGISVENGCVDMAELGISSWFLPCTVDKGQYGDRDSPIKGQYGDLESSIDGLCRGILTLRQCSALQQLSTAVVCIMARRTLLCILYRVLYVNTLLRNS
jgi:hypothetical protein